MIKRLLVTAVVAGGLLIPAAPSHAASCQASPPAAHLVVCGVVYDTVYPIACKVVLKPCR